VRHDLEHEAKHASERQLRQDLMKQLSSRVPFAVPDSLVEREIDRRLEDFARRLMEQRIDPRQANIDWKAFRDGQRTPATEAVASAIVLDEIARRDSIDVTEDDLDTELQSYAERTGHSVAAIKARLQKDGELGHLAAGLRREKTVKHVLSLAKIKKG
jgi:trigger factor